MWNILWEWQQQRAILDAQLGANRAARGAEDVRLRLVELEARGDKMALAMMAMWSILEEKLGVTEDQLARRMQEIDLRDGKLDGKVAPTAKTCPRCKRVMSVRNQRCMYCGGESLDAGAFGGF